MSQRPIIMWFRRDLRLDDQEALWAALKNSRQIIPLFIWSPEAESPWQPGAASKVWLHFSLEALDKELKRLGSRLIIRRGEAFSVLKKICQETNAAQIYAQRLYEPACREGDAVVGKKLSEISLQLKLFSGALLFEPGSIMNSQSLPFQVFTPFWRACRMSPVPVALPLAAPNKLPEVSESLLSDDIATLNLLPSVSWQKGICESWSPGLNGANDSLKLFVAGAMKNYMEGRDLPAQTGTSRLSPYLHFGEISPRRVYHEVVTRLAESNALPSRGQKVQGMTANNSAEVYLRELGWRDFAYHLLYHFPHTSQQPLRSDYASFPWLNNEQDFLSWKKGQTGYPLVDAGMRELWHCGWMHNRVRMVVASFLVKHLLISWQKGAGWFWDTLVDADLANNTLGWQWSAGCGADAAPYFRIFNPVLQGQKFDPKGDYVKRWIPELNSVPEKYIHCPWEAPPAILQAAGVELGKHYPFPIVPHQMARQRALDALSSISKMKNKTKN